MSDTKRWLAELPPGAPERELLLAARAARPPLGSVDQGWQTLGLALGLSTAATTAAAANGAVHATAAKAAAGAVSHTVTAGSFAVGVKWFVTGVALGCGVSGAATVVERISHGEARHESARSAVVLPEPRTAHEGASHVHAAPVVAPPPAVVVNREAAGDAVRAPEKDTLAASSAARRELPAPRQLESGALAAASTPPSLALSEQARELAEVKRLIDAGDAAPALVRLEASGRGGALVLSEERDALYVQALAAARRPTEARARARAFVARYPESPYLAALRGLLTNE
jgi:hypothetical protein